MGGAGGAVLNYETVDVVMPEAYSGPMGCAAIVNCVRSYPNDWSVVGDYGPGEGDQGQLYAAAYAMSLVGGRANMWFMVSRQWDLLPPHRGRHQEVRWTDLMACVVVGELSFTSRREGRGECC